MCVCSSFNSIFFFLAEFNRSTISGQIIHFVLNVHLTNSMDKAPLFVPRKWGSCYSAVSILSYPKQKPEQNQSLLLLPNARSLRTDSVHGMRTLKLTYRSDGTQTADTVTSLLFQWWNHSKLSFRETARTETLMWKSIVTTQAGETLLWLLNMTFNPAPLF